MRLQYPHQWASAYPTDDIVDEAMQLWAEKLAGLTGEQLKRGLDAMSGSFPPTVTEFRELCIGDALHNTGAYKDFERPKLLEARNKETGRAALKELKENKG